MNCPYCNNPNSYTLSTNQAKCTKCERKYSPSKIERQHKLITLFCQNYSVYQGAKELGITYPTAKKYYKKFRQLIIAYLEEQYALHKTIEYDEYLYLPKSKKKSQEHIFDAQNFLTFSYGDRKVYNLSMPNLNRYKNQFMDDGLEGVYFKEFSKFMMFNKIAKTHKRENTITKFWNYFEDSIVIYKGIKSENFFEYLKEFEFKFNHTQEEAKELLIKLSTPQYSDVSFSSR
jgi:hypothetical protein